VKEIKTTVYEASNLIVTPQKERPLSSPKSTLGKFNECVIHTTINDFYVTDKPRPTMKKIHVKLVQSIRFTGSQLILKKC
jgi:hypothetical protein